MVVQATLEKFHFTIVRIDLGEVVIKEKLTKYQLDQLSASLQTVGFELMDDQQSKLIEQIKKFIIDQIHYKTDRPGKKFSTLLAQHVQHDYSYVSNLFSQVEGITIEHYIIHQTIEKVKELLIYEELTLSQIAFHMGYSSIAHLSAQFKKFTGSTPTAFKKTGVRSRMSLDDVGKKMDSI